jgi:hypothetical protein
LDNSALAAAKTAKCLTNVTTKRPAATQPQRHRYLSVTWYVAACMPPPPSLPSPPPLASPCLAFAMASVPPLPRVEPYFKYNILISK